MDINFHHISDYAVTKQAFILIIPKTIRKHFTQLWQRQKEDIVFHVCMQKTTFYPSES